MKILDMDSDQVRDCKLQTIPDLNEAVQEQLVEIGSGARVAVLPDGPLTIPYLEST